MMPCTLCEVVVLGSANARTVLRPISQGGKEQSSATMTLRRTAKAR